MQQAVRTSEVALPVDGYGRIGHMESGYGGIGQVDDRVEARVVEQLGAAVAWGRGRWRRRRVG